jgi:hypothetical protein
MRIFGANKYITRSRDVGGDPATRRLLFYCNAAHTLKCWTVSCSWYVLARELQRKSELHVAEESLARDLLRCKCECKTDHRWLLCASHSLHTSHLSFSLHLMLLALCTLALGFTFTLICTKTCDLYFLLTQLFG